jgi:TonB family C-terminal domain
MQHTTYAATAGRFTKRATGLLLAGLLQAGFVWALVVGLDIKDLVKPFTPAIETFFPKDKVKPVDPPPVDPTVRLKDIVVPPPDLVFDGPPRTTAPTGVGIEIHPGVAAGPADHGPVSLAATHTIPPYPPMDVRLGNQGTVLLRLLVGPDGRVLDAKVIRTSGFETLDRAAQGWVMAHWRYQPAIRGGVAAQGAVDVAVKFDLRNAG